MSVIKLSEIKEMSNEQLIFTLVEVAVQTTKQGGRTTQAQHTNEQRAIKELSARIGLDEAKLTDLLNM